jgi:hypothetical protein
MKTEFLSKMLVEKLLKECERRLKKVSKNFTETTQTK